MATVRVVQMLLYAGTILFTYLLARRIFDRPAGMVAALMMAVPPVMVTLYTTVGIGAYGEALLFGTCLLWLGHRLAHEWAGRWLGWLAWGAIAGLGFWSLGLIMVYIAPVTILWLLRFERRLWPGYLVAVMGFLVCSSPWWIYDFTHNHAAMRVFYDPSSPVTVALPFSSLERLGIFLLIGVPALVGFRFPWAADYVLVYLAPAILAVYVIALLSARRRWSTLSSAARHGMLLLVLLLAGFLLAFAVTRFGIDATGRYLLPLYPPLCIVVGGWWSELRSRKQVWGSLAIAFLLTFNLGSVALAASRPAGLTTQFIPALQVGNKHDQALISFLLENDMPYGYSHHWVSFKIAFLSGEDVILAPLLPYLSRPSHDPSKPGRYPRYSEVAYSAQNPVYVTTNQPWLDEMLRAGFAEQNVGFQEATVGPYRVFHHLSRAVVPDQLGTLRVRDTYDDDRH